MFSQLYLTPLANGRWRWHGGKFAAVNASLRPKYSVARIMLDLIGIKNQPLFALEGI